MRRRFGKLDDYLTARVALRLLSVDFGHDETGDACCLLPDATTFRLMTGKRATPSELANSGFIRPSCEALEGNAPCRGSDDRVCTSQRQAGRPKTSDLKVGAYTQAQSPCQDLNVRMGRRLYPFMQLAADEAKALGARYVRKRRGVNGGVEAFAVLPRSCAFGWQVKYYRTIETALASLSESLVSALEKRRCSGSSPASPSIRRTAASGDRHLTTARIRGGLALIKSWRPPARKRTSRAAGMGQVSACA